MESDQRGCSMCVKGQEQIENFSTRGSTYIQYDYRAEDGALFSCVATSKKEARQRRDEWLQKRVAQTWKENSKNGL